MPGMSGPDRPVSYNQPYSVNHQPQYQPVPPEPYSTWTESELASKCVL